MAVTVGVVTYDVADDRRRARLHRVLEEYGVPVQESVFLLELPPSRWAEVRARALREVDRQADDVRVWTLCAGCGRRAAVWSGRGIGGPGPALFL